MLPFMLGMGQQEIAIIFIVFLFLMVVAPVLVALLGRLTRPWRDDEPNDKPRKSRRS